MSLDLLHRFREYELAVVLPLFPPGSSILELGAGTGWQARALAERGFAVEAIDLKDSAYASDRVWPIVEYDGRHIPYPDRSFDIVFSSNVLEHVLDVPTLQGEIGRVLKPGGRVVHVLPTSAWRAWTNLCHYPHLCRRVIRGLRSWDTTPAATSGAAFAWGRFPQCDASRGRLRALTGVLVPTRHGIRGSAVTEMYFFSRFHWRRVFRETGFVIEREQPARLFYTAYSLLGDRMSLRLRRAVGCCLGSAGRVYVLRTMTFDPVAAGSEERLPGGPASRLRRVL